MSTISDLNTNIGAQRSQSYPLEQLLSIFEKQHLVKRSKSWVSSSFRLFPLQLAKDQILDLEIQLALRTSPFGGFTKYYAQFFRPLYLLVI